MPLSADDAMVTLSEFNKTLKGLLLFVLAKFPTDAAILNLKAELEMALLLDPRALPKGFFKAVQPYFDEIKRRDEHYFLKKSDESEFTYINLQNRWPLFSPSDKATVWETMHKLVALSSRYCAT